MMMAAVIAASLTTVAPAAAQTAVEGRVDRLEREMRAVQRKVFPGGAGGTVEPQITTPQSIDPLPSGPVGGPITDLTARVAALETNIRSVTGQVEQNGFRIRQVEEAFNAYKRTTDARLKALEDGASTVGGSAPPAATAEADAPPRATPRPATPRPAASVAATGDPARVAAIKAIEKPSSTDPAEDNYLYGYRLWDADFHPEARAALKTVVDKYPKHRRASYSQNLIGRSLLDEGKPSLAALALNESYQKFPDGERAPDSVFYLAQALVKLKRPAAEVCKVYDALNESYGDKLSATMKADVVKGRAAQKCQ